MTKADLIAAAARGFMEAILAHESPGAPPSAVTPPSEPSVVEATLPTPSFDQAADEGQLPLIPPATLRDMERAMDSIVRGNGVPDGFYRPEDADTRAPLS